MKVTGIIAEYDPFHNGHMYQLNKAKEMTGADAAVVVMSGYFTQRGMPAFFGRDERVRMAVDGGADIVIELPYIYACNSSHEFARGAADIIDGLGCVEMLAFGAETDDMALLGDAARATDGGDAEASLFIRKLLGSGLSYPEALTRSAEALYGAETSAVLRSPNNLLGVEYIKALDRLGSGVTPVAVKRIAAPHGGAASAEPAGTAAGGNAASAAAASRRRSAKSADPTDLRTPREQPARKPAEGGSASLPPADTSEQPALIAFGAAVRKAISCGGPGAARGLVPPSSMVHIMHGDSDGVMWNRMTDKMFELIKYRLLTSEKEELSKIYGVDEGLENRLKSCIADASSLGLLTDSVKSRRYTRARISRMMCHILMNLKADDFAALRGVSYARVLGFSKTGSRLLRAVSETARIPVLSNLSRVDRYDERIMRALQYDMRASEVCRMLRAAGGAPGAERRYIPYRNFRP